MIKIENVQICGWEPTIRGMRNPLNSWAKSDTFCGDMQCHECPDNPKCELYHHDLDGGMPYRNTRTNFHDYIGPNDKDLMERLAKGGPAHAKYRRFITVYLDIVAPLYLWKEFETYKVGTDSNSCSTMHKIADKEFTLDDFSHEHLIHDRNMCFKDNLMAGPECISTPRDILSIVVDSLNVYRNQYLIATKKLKRTDLTEAERKHTKAQQKLFWWQMIQLLPSSYNQRRTIKLNYETLYRIYHDRKGHKLDEWNEFCKWIESLPLSEVITGPSLKDIPICNEIMEEAKRRVLEELEKEKVDPFDKWKDIPKEVIEKLANAPRGYKIPARYLCNLCDYNNLDDPTNEETCKRCDHYEYSKWAKIEHLVDISSPESDHPHYTIAAGAHESDLTEYEKELLKKSDEYWKNKE